MKNVSLSLIIALSFLLSTLSATVTSAAPNFADPAFLKVWERTDKIVSERPGVGRGFTWGPTSLYSGGEPYAEAPGGQRPVQYFDKARMEINNTFGNRQDPYFVTTGLLVKELVLGRAQQGDSLSNYIQGRPSEVQIAGDPNVNGNNSDAPTYRSFRNMVTFNQDNPSISKIGQQVSQKIDKNGSVSSIIPPDPNVRLVVYEPLTRHNIANVFVDYGETQGLVWNGATYLNDRVFLPNATYVLGLPISEPLWVRTRVSDVDRFVLVQLFERRILTYTPTNPDPFKVEMGNVGQHYYRWRYVENLGQFGNYGPLPTRDYSQARAPYLQSGAIPRGGLSNVSQFNTDSNFSSSWPVYDPEMGLVIVSTDNGLVAVNLYPTDLPYTDFNHPTLRWQFASQDNLIRPNAFTPVTLYDHVIYCGGEGGKVFAVSEWDGSLLWQASLGFQGFDSLIVPDETSLYFVNGWERKLYSLNISDGSLRWAVRPNSEVGLGSGPILGWDGIIYVGGDDRKLYAYYPDGTPLPSEKWNPPTLDSNVSHYSLAAKGQIYAGTTNGTLYAIDNLGRISSQIKLGGGQGILTVPAIVYDYQGPGRVYVGTDEGRIYGLDAADVSKIQWTFQIPGTPAPYARSSVAVVDNYVYFGADNGNLYKVSGADSRDSVVLASANAPFGTNPVVVNSGYVVIVSRDGVLHFVR